MPKVPFLGAEFRDPVTGLPRADCAGAFTDHRVDVWVDEGMTFWRHGFFEFESDQPLLDASRWLLAEGIAAPGDRVTTFRGEVVCLTALVEVAAGLDVMEDPQGVRFVKHRRVNRPFGKPCKSAAD